MVNTSASLEPDDEPLEGWNRDDSEDDDDDDSYVDRQTVRSQ